MLNFYEDIHLREHFYEHIECLSDHLSKYFEEDEITIFHEMLSPDFHLDVYLIRPANRNYAILLTSGASLLRMSVPDTIPNAAEYEFAEYMLLLPKDIEFAEVVNSKEGDKNDWIITMLKDIARFPHHYNTFFAIGHTVQATEERTPYSPETNFVGSALLPSVTFDEGFTKFMCGMDTINIYSVFPLYRNELEFKMDKGYSDFIQLLIDGNVPEIFDENRPNLLG